MAKALQLEITVSDITNCHAEGVSQDGKSGPHAISAGSKLFDPSQKVPWDAVGHILSVSATRLPMGYWHYKVIYQPCGDEPHEVGSVLTHFESGEYPASQQPQGSGVARVRAQAV
jgi:hypothetical protein